MTEKIILFPGLGVTVDGCDGAGKGAPLFAMRMFEELNGFEVFDVDKYELRTGSYADVLLWNQPGTTAKDRELLKASGEEGRLAAPFNTFDAYQISEMGYGGVDAELRFRALNRDIYPFFSARFVGQNYAIGRWYQHALTQIPLRSAGVRAFSSRNLLASLVFQPRSNEKFQQIAAFKGVPDEGNDIGGIEEVLSWEGNYQCFRNPHDLLIIPTITDMDELMRRITSREGDDRAVWETADFQKQVAEAYNDPALIKLFTDRGVRVEYINAFASTEKEESIRVAMTETLNHYVSLLEQRGELDRYERTNVEELVDEILPMYLNRPIHWGMDPRVPEEFRDSVSSLDSIRGLSDTSNRSLGWYETVDAVMVDMSSPNESSAAVVDRAARAGIPSVILVNAGQRKPQDLDYLAQHKSVHVIEYQAHTKKDAVAALPLDEVRKSID